MAKQNQLCANVERLVGILRIISEDVINSFFPPERTARYIEKLNTVSLKQPESLSDFISVNDSMQLVTP